MAEPDKLIEHQGYVYKLLNSKEEQKEIDKRKLEERNKAFGAFKQKIGTRQYEYLHANEITLSYTTGGNYSVTVYFDFKDNLTWTTDEYSHSEKKHFGDTDWYSYDRIDFNNSFVTAAIHKMLQDHFFELATS
jgi:hypothetical protein